MMDTSCQTSANNSRPMKQRDLLKSRVKRSLKDQKDMGQVSEAAVFACSAAVQIFVKDITAKMQQQAVEAVGLTPVELKKSVLACGELNFLHEKVTVIDESNAKYHKPARGGKKRALVAAAKKSIAKKARMAKTKKTTPAPAATETDSGKKTKRQIHGRDDDNYATVTKKAATLTQALEVEEDEDYDESDSDA